MSPTPLRPLAPLAAALAAALLAGCADKPSPASCSTSAECPSGAACHRGVCQIADLDPPAIVTTSPVNNATNVWTRDPITVTFDEAMAPGSVTNATVILASNRTGGAPIATTAALSPDGRTLTVFPTTLPEVAAQLTLTLDGLTDAAGNPLATASFTWTAPEWQDLGTALTSASSTNIVMSALAVDPNGAPVVTAYWLGGSSGGAIRRYAGSGADWDPITWPTLSTGYPISASLVARSNDVVATFGVTGGAGYDVWAGSWNGSAWWDTWVLDVTSSDVSKTPSAALDAAGAPYVAWVETVGVARVFAKRWSGASWDLLGGGAASSPTIPASALVATAGATRVTWIEADGATTTVKSSACPSTAWQTPLSAPLTASQLGGVPAANAAGTAYVMVVTPGGKLQVSQWFPGGGMIPSYWGKLGSDLNTTTEATFPAMTFDPGGAPVVAWYDSTAGSSGVWVRRWDPTTTSWQTLTSAARLTGTKMLLGVGSDGVIAVGRHVGVPPSTAIQVARYNR